MRTRKLTLGRGVAILAMATLALAGHQVRAAEYWLKAAATTVDMPNPDYPGVPGAPPKLSVAMWGYVSCTPAFAACESVSNPVTVPGPSLAVPSGDTTLTINLLNGLSRPTSLVVHGLSKALTPVWDDGSPGPRPSPTARVRSFDAEAAAGGTQKYEWGPTLANPSAPAVRPGTYLYQSGTQPQVQVQMGLYGALTKNAVEASAGPTPTRAQAYAGVEYDSQATLLYSEIDPALHQAVATGTYGTTGPTSTIDYAPRYFLVNGQPFPFGTPVIGASGATLLRFLNAGLTTHVPMVQGRHWSLVAEDGKPYPFRASQYTALLPAAKTVDVLLTPDAGGASYPVMDRRLGLSNSGTANGGMLAFLQYGATGAPGSGAAASSETAPTAVDDSYSTLQGVTLSVGAPAGVLANDMLGSTGQALKAVAASGSTALGGTYALAANGSFTYTPPAAALPGSPTDSFSYRVTDGKWLSTLPATVLIGLPTPVPPALALLDDFNRSTGLDTSSWGQTVASGSTANIVIDATNQFAAAVATDQGGQAIWIKDTDPGAVDTSVLGASQYAAFSSPALTNSALILKATGGTAREAPANFVRVRHEGTSVVVYTMMGGSNVSTYVKQAAFAAGASHGTLSAAVDGKGLVTVFLDGLYLGGVQLPDVGAWKGGGRVGIQIQTLGSTIDDFSAGSL